ncbi:Putative sensory transduction regulator [Paracoccus halophilus]|uniref:Putative sensory transduction regulator n=1 Tax=Paracoccus halophilus TaxID=376733 RepID=A0A099F5Q1_9RHOB|nr:YbjN domain-containing protein [Paracoccus halophilus]KGJ05799.1 hypothetical protein IT41_03770 [Paracoccus halophilus]SFA41053.1 Putative sensory transduction regulator [Paracoccus halophilus]
MRVLILFPVALMLASSVVAAQVRGDPDLIQRMMADTGLRVTQLADNKGDPMLESRIDDVLFRVHFFDCQATCAAMQFSAGFQLDAPLPIEMANLWNRERRFGRVYLDRDGDPFIEMDIGLTGEGIGRRNFKDALDIWRVLLNDFRDFIDW